MDWLFECLIGIVGFICSLALGVFLLMVLWAAVPGPLSCSAFGEGMKLKTEYRFWYGCFVTMEGGEVLPESIARKVLEQRYKLEVR